MLLNSTGKILRVPYLRKLLEGSHCLLTSFRGTTNHNQGPETLMFLKENCKWDQLLKYSAKCPMNNKHSMNVKKKERMKRTFPLKKCRFKKIEEITCYERTLPQFQEFYNKCFSSMPLSPLPFWMLMLNL